MLLILVFALVAIALVCLRSRLSLSEVLFGLLLVPALSGCPSLPKPDGCTPLTTRCSPKGVPQVCSQTQRWTEIGQPCASVGATCCYARSPFGHELYACVRAESCLPDPPVVDQDGGAE